MRPSYKILFFAFGFLSLASSAQIDTTKKQVIDITSSYKPVLRNAVKINFSATNLLADTSKPKFQYNIPAQSLFYTYKPISLKPLAFEPDQSLLLGDRNFVKVGLGNFNTAYLKAGLSFGDGKTSLANVYADYVTSKGKIEFQQYSQLNIKATGSYFTAGHEVYGGIGFSQNTYYQYGYNHAMHTNSKDSIRQLFQDVAISAGFRNSDVNDLGVNYNPNIQLNIFNNRNKVSETTFLLDVPVNKTINDIFTIKVALKGDFTSYKTKEEPVNVSLKNNIVALVPELVYAKPLLTIHAGVTPVWINKKVTALPNIYAEWQFKENVFLFQAGWVGRYIKNSYRYLTSLNPYLSPIMAQQNTREVELYGGIKATAGKHFVFSAKAGFVNYHDLALFMNDTTSVDEKEFIVSNSPKAKNLRFHADMSFISQDKFTITGGITFNGYTGLVNNPKAWGTVPIEVNASMRWWAFKKVLLKGDLLAFSGGPYASKGNVQQSLSGAADLSAGIEYSITKKISAWFDINNILNNKYQRWHNYDVYGANFLIGGIYKF